MSNPNELYPLQFEPIYKQKVWGGRGLEKLGRALPGDASVGIGESWEIADLTTTSASGGGGNAEHSVVANGPLEGKTLREVMQTYGAALLGEGVSPADDGGFPLLIKFLDAKENLSVQVHPSPAYAAEHADACLKSEAWYVVDADPGARIYKGLAPGTTPQMLRDALKVNTDEAVVPLLNAIEVIRGDCHYLPSGTLHALGAGVLVAEVQTPSDTTFRVYDWGRTDRALHVEQAMACIDFEQAGETDSALPEPSTNGSFDFQPKAACAYFQIDEVTCASTGHAHVLLASAEVWIGLEGKGLVSDRADDAVALHPGQSVLLPAGLGEFGFAANHPGRWLRITMPSAAR